MWPRRWSGPLEAWARGWESSFELKSRREELLAVRRTKSAVLKEVVVRWVSAWGLVGQRGLVGAPGIEPGTSTSQKWRATSAPRPA